MSRRVEEFYCSIVGGGCGKYFKTYLRTNMFGNYTVRCPACNHDHFRVIQNGLVTDDRHSDRYGTSEIIIGLASTLSDVPYHNDPIFRRSQIKAYNGGIAPC